MTAMMLRRLASMILATGIGLSSWSSISQAETVWKLQSMWLAGSLNQKLLEDFCATIEKASGGRLKIEPLPINAVVQNTEGLEAVGAGIVDAMHISPVYFAGHDSAFGLLGDLNAAYEDPYQMQMWYHYRGGLEMARELYAQHNVYFVGPGWWGVESMPFKMPIRTLADFQGKKVRVPEGPSGEIFRRLGAAPVALPGTEVYTALERGVIDGTDYGTLAMNEGLGFHKVAKFPVYPGIHSMPVVDISVNMDKWNALPDDLKELLTVAVRDFARDQIQRVVIEDIKARETVVENGVELVSWSEEDRRKLREIAKGVWEEYSKGEMAQRVYNSQIEWIKDLGLL